jgi:hypothetical protein
MEAVCSFETSIFTYKSTQHSYLKDKPDWYGSENLKSLTLKLISVRGSNLATDFNIYSHTEK